MAEKYKIHVAGRQSLNIQTTFNEIKLSRFSCGRKINLNLIITIKNKGPP